VVACYRYLLKSDVATVPGPPPHVLVDRGYPPLVAVRQDDMQPLPRIGLGDLLQEAEELLMTVPRIAGIGHLAGRDLERDLSVGAVRPGGGPAS
jgi:hypothetical protein